MKYIIIRDREDKEHAIVFPNSVIHADVARIHRASDVRVVAAGFCSLWPTVTCWGESESIRKKSRAEDSAIIYSSFTERPKDHGVNNGDIEWCLPH
jgi:hypothetical protein